MAEAEVFSSFVIGPQGEGDHVHAETLADSDHSTANSSCADHTQRLSGQVEATQPVLRKVAPPGAFSGLDDMPAEREQERENVLGYGGVSIIRHVADSDARLSTI